MPYCCPLCRQCLVQWLPSSGRAFGGSDGKEPALSVGDPGSIPGLGRCPGEGNGNPLQHPCLENPWMEEPGGLLSMGLQKVGHN